MNKYFERKYLNWADELDGKTLAEVTHVINDLIDKFGKDTKLILENNWDTVDYYIEYERCETESEKADRLFKERKQERADRTRYEKLKAKYGWE